MEQTNQSLNQTAEDDIKKIREVVEMLKKRGVQSLEGDLTEKVEELVDRHFERAKRLAHCEDYDDEDDAFNECIKLMNEIALDTLMYDLIKKGLSLLVDGVKSGVIKTEELPNILENVNLVLESMETFRRLLVSLDERGLLKLAELIATDKSFLDKLTNFLIKMATERKRVEQLLNEDREFAEKVRSIVPNLPSLITV
jgi:flagellar motor component MotA